MRACFTRADFVENLEEVRAARRTAVAEVAVRKQSLRSKTFGELTAPEKDQLLQALAERFEMIAPSRG